jgi:lipid-A-disaccharide synthase
MNASPITEDAGPLIFLLAGEHSGDALGARLMDALLRRTGGRIRFAGVGGPMMEARGLQSLFPMSEIAVIGVAEIVPRLPALLRRIRQTAAAANRMRPDAVVSIDTPDFSFRVQRRLGALDTCRIHYVAPQVWAWKPWRAKALAAVLDRLLVMLPFEPPLFERYGLSTTFVGHPVIESGADRGDGPRFRARHGIPAGSRVLCLLPGSRMGEVRRMLPAFAGAAGRLAERFPGLVTVLPTMPGVARYVVEQVAGWRTPPLVLDNDGEKYDAMASADAALAASGTVALELALAGTPSVIGYRMSPLTWRIVRAMVKVEYANIVNILLGREAVPERLQDGCTPEALASAAARLIEDPAAAAAQRDACAEAIAMLRDPEALPSDRAAEAVLACLGTGGKKR